MTAEAPRLFTPAFVALSLADLAYFTAAGLMIPITPLFAAGPLGADKVWVGISVGAFSVSALLLRPFAGRASDRRGRRPLLIGGALLFAVATALHAVTSDLAVLIALRLVLGVAEASFFVAGFAALADLAPPQRAGEALSFNSLSLYMGIAIGPLVGERLLDIGGFGLAWVGGALLALTAAVLATRIPETADLGADAPPVPLFHRGAALPALGLVSGVAGMAGFFAFVALYADDLGMSGSSVVLLAFGLIVVGCRVVFARLPDRVPPFGLAAGALLLIGVGLLIVSVVQSFIGLMVGASVMAVGVAFTTPAFFAAIAARVTRSERGAAFGTVSIFLDLAFGGGPILVGLVAGAAGIPAGFAAAAGIAAVGGAGTALAAVRARRVLQPTA